MGKIFKTVCLTLASILLVGGLGIGGYKLVQEQSSPKVKIINTVDSEDVSSPTATDNEETNAVSFYEAEVSTFGYSLANVEDNFIDGVLISEDIDDLEDGQVASFLNKAIKDNFLVYNPDDKTILPHPVNGNSDFYDKPSYYDGFGYCAYGWPPSGIECIYKLTDEGLFVRLFSSEIGFSNGGTINSPTKNYVTFEFNEGYSGTPVVMDNSQWVKSYFFTNDEIVEGMTEQEKSAILNRLFETVTCVSDGTVISGNRNYDGWPYVYGESPYPSWGVYEEKLSNFPNLGCKFVNGGVYVVFPYSCELCGTLDTHRNAIVFSGMDGDCIFDTYEEAEAYEPVFSFELKENEGFEYQGVEIMPYVDNKCFYEAVHINNTKTNYSFENLVQAREMLGFTENDGELTMVGRNDYENYLEYVFNLNSENLNIELKVKVDKNNNCVLEYNNFYYTDSDGTLQTFSTADIIKSDSPFVYFGETETDYYYLQKIDETTSYKLKISKEILTIESNIEVA